MLKQPNCLIEKSRTGSVANDHARTEQGSLLKIIPHFPAQLSNRLMENKGTLLINVREK
ncbi:hypothetical protein BN8_02512 [Fibrisoma limi BUZ 3]|uniref:Uncharacterized protein n=1 Tax=Fibrisoma limi BUZ 3 TaxID=1185876 RepID=I2GHP4_9BACT|nr:hypothetical protein BN8_02512 [Fibrisoma limi BUZ 3]